MRADEISGQSLENQHRTASSYRSHGARKRGALVAFEIQLDYSNVGGTGQYVVQSYELNGGDPASPTGIEATSTM